MANNDNNDPIKEYKPFRFGIKNFEDDFELNSNDFSDDLHNCSNDLSDKGSKKEEISHAKFADKARETERQAYQAKYERAWSKTSVNNNKKNNGVIAIVVILIILANVLPVIIGLVVNITDELTISQEESVDLYGEFEEDVLEEEFEIYKSNISLQMHKLGDGSNIVQLYNANDKSFSDITIEIVFYDEFGKILKIEDTYIGMLIAENEHFFEIYDAPSEYARYEYNIVNSYGKYSDITKEDIHISRENYNSQYEITLTNYTNEEIDCAQVYVAYFKENVLIKVETCYFFDIKSGKEQSQMFYLYDENEIDEIRMNLNDVDIY